MTLDDVKRVFHATPPEFAPYLEYAYHLQYGDGGGIALIVENLEPVPHAAVYDPLSVLDSDVVASVAKVASHVDVDVDLYSYGLLWRRFFAFMDVRESETVKGRLAYYQSLDRRASNIRTPIKIRRFLTKYDVFNEWGERQSEMQGLFASYLDTTWGKTDMLDVRTLDHDDVDGWDVAFNEIRSCMSRVSDHGVGVRNSYLCYMTKHHGLDDNGVRLTVLYQDSKPVARTLTYENEDGKYYVRNYGDDRLVSWLDDNGYNHTGTLPIDTLLYTWLYEGDDKDADYIYDLVHPYLDGDNNRAELIAENGKLAFVIQSEGYELGDASGSLGIDYLPHCCTHCGAFADTKLYAKYADIPRVYKVQLCSMCESDNVVTVDKGTPHELKVYSKYVERGGTVFHYNDGLFTTRGLDYLGRTVVGGNVVSASDVGVCCITGQPTLKKDLVDLSDYPQEIQDSYAFASMPFLVNLESMYHLAHPLEYMPHPVTRFVYAPSGITTVVHTSDGMVRVLDSHLGDVLCYETDHIIQGALVTYPRLVDIASRVKEYRNSIIKRSPTKYEHEMWI